VTERAAPRPLFGLAPHGVYPASRITAAAVRSYRTFSPLPTKYLAGGIVFCGTFRETRFERIPPAVSRHAALWRPDFPPTFVSGCPSDRPVIIIGGRACSVKVGNIRNKWRIYNQLVYSGFADSGMVTSRKGQSAAVLSCKH